MQSGTMRISLITWSLVAVLTTIPTSSAADRRLNVLFLVSDDMRPELGVYQGPDFPSFIHPKIKTPNLDRLARQSLLLKRAYVQQALCSPSRTSLLTGRRVDTTRTYDLYQYFRDIAGNFTTIPQYFKENGYLTRGFGKIFHPGHTSGGDDPISWTVPNWQPDLSHWRKDMRVTWTIADDTEVKTHPLEDMQVASKAMDTLRQISKSAESRPFFLAAGFRRPHLPFLCPRKFYDLYPLDDVRLPTYRYSPIGMPEIAWADNAELRQYADMLDGKWYGAINQTLSKDVTLNLRRAYYACTSYTDSLVGEIMATLEELGLNDTIVVFWGDHGWQLGENAEWSKSSNFELATHAPMFIRIPGLTDGGIVTERLTEFVDLFPTLADAAGLAPIPLCPDDSRTIATCTEGVSLMPLVRDPAREWKTAAFSQYPRFYISGNIIMGYTMRTDRYRYTQWVVYDPLTSRPITMAAFMNSVEIYDHKVDPMEHVNVAEDPKYKAVRQQLYTQWKKGWRYALPKL